MYTKEIRDGIHAKKWIKMLDGAGIQALIAREYLAKGKLLPAIESLEKVIAKRREENEVLYKIINALKKEVNT